MARSLVRPFSSVVGRSGRPNACIFRDFNRIDSLCFAARADQNRVKVQPTFTDSRSRVMGKLTKNSSLPRSHSRHDPACLFRVPIRIMQRSDTGYADHQHWPVTWRERRTSAESLNVRETKEISGESV